MRIESVYPLLKEHGIDALWIEDPNDLFYLTGEWFSAGRLIIEKKGATLLLDGRYFESAKKKLKFLNVVLSDREGSVNPAEDAKTIGFDGTSLSFDRVGVLKKTYGKEWVSVPSPLKSLRVCKDKNEIEALRRAAKLTWDGYQFILTKLKEGITEKELAYLFEEYVRKNGGSKLSFDPIIAFGENSAYPHYRAGDAKLKKNQMVLIDVGAVVGDYHGDMTRTHFFGEPDCRLKKMADCIKHAHDQAFNAVKPGVKIGKLDEIVRAEFKKEGVENLFTHGLGHGIGLETHEYPRLRFDGKDKDVLIEKGFVFTIEPGLYLPGLGGVRYENTIYVTETGAVNFYANI